MNYNAEDLATRLVNTFRPSFTFGISTNANAKFVNRRTIKLRTKIVLLLQGLPRILSGVIGTPVHRVKLRLFHSGIRPK